MTPVTQAVSWHAGLLGAGRDLTVRAVFQRAWHLTDDRGRVATVIARGHNGPLTVCVDCESLDRWSVRPGDRATWDRSPGRGELRAGACRIELPDVCMWDATAIRLDTVRVDALHRDLHALVRQSRIAARGGLPAYAVLPTRDSSDDVLPGRRPCRAAEAVRRLLGGLLAGESEAIDAGVAGLVGLGPGLTPSGDDLLAGVAAGMHVFQRRVRHSAHEMSRRLEALRRAIAARADNTTALGRTLLHYAGEGVVAQPLLDLLYELGVGDGEPDASALFDIGHSSGSDMLTGAVLAGWLAMGMEERRGSAVVRPH